MNKLVITLFTLIFCSQAFAKRVIDQTQITDRVNISHYKSGLLLAKEWKELTHPTCILHVSEKLPSSIETTLVKFGYRTILTQEVTPKEDELLVTVSNYKSFENRYGCGETHLNMSLSIGVSGQWSKIILIDNMVACIADHTYSATDINSLFITELMPKCIVNKN